jgi:hypothetical protein
MMGFEILSRVLEQTPTMYKLQKYKITVEEALLELDSMYKVYLQDEKKGFQVSRVVTLTKKQEVILKAVDRKILKS